MLSAFLLTRELQLIADLRVLYVLVVGGGALI
jgi:hypothetical protein